MQVGTLSVGDLRAVEQLQHQLEKFQAACSEAAVQQLDSQSPAEQATAMIGRNPDQKSRKATPTSSSSSPREHSNTIHDPHVPATSPQESQPSTTAPGNAAAALCQVQIGVYCPAPSLSMCIRSIVKTFQYCGGLLSGSDQPCRHCVQQCCKVSQWESLRT